MEPNGNIYEGQWLKDLRNDEKALYKIKDGEAFLENCTWKEDILISVGSYKRKKGEIEIEYKDCTFENNKLVKATSKDA